MRRLSPSLPMPALLTVNALPTAPGGLHPFSVPWSDITASHDEGPGLPLKGRPMVRLALAADPGLRILVNTWDDRQLATASGARLTIEGSGPAAAAARS